LNEIHPYRSIGSKCTRTKIMEMGSNNKYSFTYIKEFLDGSF